MSVNQVWLGLVDELSQRPDRYPAKSAISDLVDWHIRSFQFGN
jgi:hypothetical protein